MLDLRMGNELVAVGLRWQRVGKQFAVEIGDLYGSRIVI